MSAHIAFQVHYRDYQGSLPTYLKIYNPNGNIFQTWSYTDKNTLFTRAASRYGSFDFPANAVSGTWRFEVKYNGIS